MFYNLFFFFTSTLQHLHQKNPEILNKPGAIILVLEILNYRLFSLYRYQGKNKSLMYDVTKILSTLKGKRGEHRVFRLAENLCMNLIMSLREFFFVKKDGKVRYLLFSYLKYIFLPSIMGGSIKRILFCEEGRVDMGYVFCNGPKDIFTQMGHPAKHVKCQSKLIYDA
ncbi:putative mediator complex, subunit Med23 [Helianthus annuus]|nr:putative mediator complex, subunit Med23 [Helianthus annuus]